MKETVKINLNQQLFDLDADAYEKLKKYLNDLENIFRESADEAEEILQDIEQRIAELLHSKLSTSKQVITLKDIDEVVDQLGTAEDFARITGEDKAGTFGEEEASAEMPEEDEAIRGQRRFYRDIDNNILGGVCAGLGAYFNIDPVWVRLGLLLLFFLKGFGLLIYLILWVVVPAARTTAQKLQMRGRPVNVENIQDHVKAEFSKVKDNWKSYSRSESYQRSRQAASDVFSILGNIFVVIAKVILVLIGVGFALGLLILLITLFSGISSNGFFHGWHWPRIHPGPDLFPFFYQHTLFGIAVLLVVLIPVIAIMVGILRVILNVRSRNRILSAFGWTIWSLALVFVIFSLITMNFNAPVVHHTTEEKLLDLNQHEILYVEMDHENFRHRTPRYHFFGREIVHDKFSDRCYLQPVLQIESTTADRPFLVIEENAMLPDFEENDFTYYNYLWEFHDSVLILPAFFSVDEEDFWQIPGMRIMLYLPEDQKIKLDRDLYDMLDLPDDSHWLDEADFYRPLQMQNRRLTPVLD